MLAPENYFLVSRTLFFVCSQARKKSYTVHLEVCLWVLQIFEYEKELKLPAKHPTFTLNEVPSTAQMKANSHKVS